MTNQKTKLPRLACRCMRGKLKACDVLTQCLTSLLTQPQTNIYSKVSWSMSQPPIAVPGCFSRTFLAAGPVPASRVCHEPCADFLLDSTNCPHASWGESMVVIRCTLQHTNGRPGNICVLLLMQHIANAWLLLTAFTTVAFEKNSRN